MDAKCVQAVIAKRRKGKKTWLMLPSHRTLRIPVPSVQSATPAANSIHHQHTKRTRETSRSGEKKQAVVRKKT